MFFYLFNNCMIFLLIGIFLEDTLGYIYAFLLSIMYAHRIKYLSIFGIDKFNALKYDFFGDYSYN